MIVGCDEIQHIMCEKTFDGLRWRRHAMISCRVCPGRSQPGSWFPGVVILVPAIATTAKMNMEMEEGEVAKSR